MAAENNKYIEIRRRLDIKKNVVQMIMERKLKLFGHICGMDDNQSVKDVVFGIVGGHIMWGRPSREWMDDIKEWWLLEVHTLGIMMKDRSE